ncbi:MULTISPECIES: Ger(x)C family spore germination protein [unclassified Paenibacillus]|uniref:Ger(x)C family spore germination protein n=1 Tax=unclassified Paenibacillus TaxID=185978 RepID=UPI00363DBE06
MKLGFQLCAWLLLLTLLTGCWNRRELNELGIQMGMAIDKIGDQYQLAVQVVVPGEVSSRLTTGRSPVTLYKASAPTIFEAFRKLTETSPRKIYSAHTRVLVIGESLAQEGIGKILDLLSRNPEARTDYYVIVSRGIKAEEVLKVMTSLEKIPANNLFYSLDTSSKNWAPTTTVTMDQAILQLVTSGLNLVLPGVEVLGNLSTGDSKSNVDKIENAGLLQSAGLAIFDKDKLIGWLNEDESKGYNYIRNNVKSTAGHIKCPDGGVLALETLRSDTKMKVSFDNGEPLILIGVVIESNIGEVECKIDITEPDTIVWLEHEAEKKLRNLLQHTINKVKSKYNVDVFGFGQAVYKKDPKVWKKLKGEWKERFPRLKVNYDINVTIRRTGTTNNSFQNNIKE